MHTEPNPLEPGTANLRRVPTVPGGEYAQLRADGASRLSRVCGDMPAEAFDALVEDICAMKIRWAQKTAFGRDD